MKRVIFLAIALFAACTIFAQAGIYLYLPSITNGAGSGAIHADESRLSSLQNGVTINVSGSVSGVPVPSDFVCSKDFDFSSLKLQTALLKGQPQNFAEFRYYDAADNLKYVIRLESVFLSSYNQSNDGSGCSAGCQTIQETYSFTGKKVITSNYANGGSTPTQKLTWDRLTNTITYQ